MIQSPSLYTDITAPSWIMRLPRGWHPYARLMRLDRPIGTWLLLIPCWWGMAWTLPDGALWSWDVAWMAGLFALGALIMRGAGCVVNDLYDRDLDARVERTSLRPLPSGEVTVRQALALLAVLVAIGGLILLTFDWKTVGVGAASLILVALYPLMKRVTWWPQLFLGFTFNWGVLVGGMAVAHTLSPSLILLYLAGVAWTLGYDTIYAFQDIADDEKIGVKSTARLFKAHPKWAVGGFYALFFTLILAACVVEGKDWTVSLNFVLAALYQAWQIYQWNPANPADCLKRFKDNRNEGLFVLLGLISV